MQRRNRLQRLEDRNQRFGVELVGVVAARDRGGRHLTDRLVGDFQGVETVRLEDRSLAAALVTDGRLPLAGGQLDYITTQVGGRIPLGIDRSRQRVVCDVLTRCGAR